MISRRKSKVICIVLFILFLLTVIGSIVFQALGRNFKSQIQYKDNSGVGALLALVLFPLFFNTGAGSSLTTPPAGPSAEDQLLMQKSESCYLAAKNLSYLSVALFVLLIVMFVLYWEYRKNNQRGYNAFNPNWNANLLK